MATFKVGDLVKLKSGSPVMTVADPSSGSGTRKWVRCSWFAGSKLSHGDFDSDELVVASTTDKASTK